MFLVELVMQGVRGIRELARLRFQSGFNLVAAGNESGKTTSVDSMLRLLFPINQAGAFDGLVSRHTPDASRAALVVYSDDGVYYRVIQDYSKAGINLSKYNAAAKDFGLLSKDWSATLQFMTGLTGGISEQDYARLFVFRRDYYAGASSGVPAAAAMRRPAAPDRKKNTEAQEARLAELREALRKAEEAADMDYRLQSAKLKLEEIRTKMEKFAEIDGRAAELAAQLDGLRACETLPPDLNRQLEEHDQRQREKMVKSDELNADIEGLKLQLDGIPPMNLLKDAVFLLGAALGGLAVIAGVFALTSQNIFLAGVLLAFVLMAVGWYRGSVKNAERKAIAREIERTQNELRELEKTFTQGGGAIQQAMKAVGAATAAELKEKADQYRYFLSLKGDLDEERSRLLKDSSSEEIHREYEKQQHETHELEQQIAGLPHETVDTYSLRQDIERLEAETAGSDPGKAGGDAAPDFAFAMPPQAAAGGVSAELGAASRIGEIEMETLLPAVESAVQRNLSAATGGKYVRVEIGHEGDPAVHLQDHSVVKVSGLSHGTRDLFYLCFRAGLVEALAGKRRLPFILDDPLAGFDTRRQQAACQILRSLGAKTQVVLFTSNPALRAPADVVLELK